MLFCDLLFDELMAQQSGNESRDCRKPVMRLAGSDGNQGENQCEGSHDQSPYVKWLTVSTGSS
jgi:hypothetical protein